MSVLFQNPHRGKGPIPSPAAEPLQFHQTLPGYAQSQVKRLDGAARELGFDSLVAKVEHPRFDLPSFKILGASWAIAKAIEAAGGAPVRTWPELVLAARARLAKGPLSLAAATDGNHGRAVARVAKWLSLPARVFVPDSVSEARKAAIRGEGAEVVTVAGNYELAVRTAAATSSEQCVNISDVQLTDDDLVPAWLIDGYASMFFELDRVLAERAWPAPTVVLVQIGVGALAAAVVRHFRRPGLQAPPLIVGVEPLRAACALESVKRGELYTLPWTADSAMGGLNCEVASKAAWPELLYGIDAYVAIEDDFAFRAMRAFSSADIVAGESGSAGLAGLMAVLAEGTLQLPSVRHGFVVVTEGATDAAAYERVVGAAPSRAGESPRT